MLQNHKLLEENLRHQSASTTYAHCCNVIITFFEVCECYPTELAMLIAESKTILPIIKLVAKDSSAGKLRAVRIRNDRDKAIIDAEWKNIIDFFKSVYQKICKYVIKPVCH